MIPKKIHYCWFGRAAKPALALQCIESWKRFLPEYEIVEWNEDNFDLSEFPYAAEAYARRKFAFVTDVVRLYALYTQGGVYMDTDVEVLRPLESILGYKAVSGFETTNLVPTGLMASEAGVAVIGEMLDDYRQRQFTNPDGTLNTTTNVIYITDTLKKYGIKLDNQLQTVADFTFLPADYLCPKSVKDGKIYLTDNTLAIHHFAGSWHSPWRNGLRNIILAVGGYRLKKILRSITPNALLEK